MKTKNYYSLGVTVLLGSTLLVGCAPSRVHHHSEYSSQSQDYHPYQQREYEERQPQEREQPRYNQHQHREQPQEREQPRYYPQQHSEDNGQQRQPQVEPSTEREPVRQRPQTRPQNNSTPEISAPSVQTQTVNKSSPIEKVTPEPVVVKQPTITPPVQPCSRRIGCEDSSSTHTDSSRRER